MAQSRSIGWLYRGRSKRTRWRYFPGSPRAANNGLDAIKGATAVRRQFGYSGGDLRLKLQNSFLVVLLLCAASPLIGQSNAPDSGTTLRINSRAVLLDVAVYDRKGAPVTGLKPGDFTVLERGKPQVISFFREHNRAANGEQGKKLELPQPVTNVFSNFSPFPTPPVVNVLLLDALNTQLEDQMVARKAAVDYLKTVKVGSRLAIFTLSTRLSLVEGFSDDPALLAAAMGFGKGGGPEASSSLRLQAQGNAEADLIGMMSQQAGGGAGAAPAGMIGALQNFMSVSDYSQVADRIERTLASLQDIATLLGRFPGRKNLIWLSGSFPLNYFGITSAKFAGIDTATDARFEGGLKKTVDLLTAARVAVYPVDAHGVRTEQFYSAQNTLDASIHSPAEVIGGAGVQTGSLLNESISRNRDYETEDELAEETGGTAFKSTNGLAEAINRIVSSSANFYTLSYAPTDTKMDGSYRHIEVKVAGDYTLSYRRGYFADEAFLPGAVQHTRDDGNQRPSLVDPLRPAMYLGMPQAEDILYKVLIQALPREPKARAKEKHDARSGQNHYSVDFAIDSDDLGLTMGADGLRKGTLIVSLIVYDKYSQAASRKDYKVDLAVTPDAWTADLQTGVQLHAEVEAPKGQFWLRTGVYDETSDKLGTLEIPLNYVSPPHTGALQ